MEKQTTKCPMTGKMIPVPETKVDLVEPKRISSKAAASELARVAQGMADIRAEWAKMGADKRSSAEGRALIQRHRYFAAQFKALTHQEPVPIWADQ